MLSCYGDKSRRELQLSGLFQAHVPFQKTAKLRRQGFTLVVPKSQDGTQFTEVGPESVRLGNNMQSSISAKTLPQALSSAAVCKSGPTMRRFPPARHFHY